MAEITEKFEKFVKALYDQKLITVDDNNVYWNHKTIRNMENWPKNLDMENFEIELIQEDIISGLSGGDWQDYARFNLYYDEKKKKVCLVMFDDPACYSHGEKYKEKDIIQVLENKKSVKESLVEKFLAKM